MMRLLSSNEKQAVSVTLKPLLKDKDVIAYCVYGSQIAGYPTERSDYDVIIVAESFHQKIKYYYLKDETRCSALVVASKSFEGDCTKSNLGEFVSGRLLNCYEALSGGEYIRRNEVEYKKNVILEGLEEAFLENQQFTSLIEIELSYFLFEKLRKRAAIYPPVMYSYAMTYGREHKPGNLEASLTGFREAAKVLQADGIIDFNEQNDYVRLVSCNFTGGLRSKIGAKASFTAKSLTQYAVHGYAGRVGLDVIGREVISKLSRSRRHFSLPEEIRSPKKYWSSNRAKLFAETEDWYSDLLLHLGVDKSSVKISEKPMGEFYNAARAFSIDDGKRRLSVAVKRYKDVKSVKWVLVNLWSLKNTNFSMNPLERMTREYRALGEFKKFGINTPSPIALFLSEKMLVTEFIHGKDLSQVESDYLESRSDDLEPIRRFGEILATIHNNGYCMGDTKPSNAIISYAKREVFLVDLEQAHQRGNCAWDIGEFVYYSTMFTLKEEKSRKIIDSFVQGYLGEARDATPVRKAASLRYRAPFQAFIAPNILSSVQKYLAKS